MEYNYRLALENDIRDYLKDHDTRDREELYDDLFTEDSVTGNASGSYWCNANKAKECVLGDPHAEEYIREAISDFGITADEVAKHFMDWEYWDVTIRCSLLYNVIDDTLTWLQGEV